MHINPTYWRQAGTAINFQLEMNFYNRSTNRKEIAYVDYHQKHGRLGDGATVDEARDKIALLWRWCAPVKEEPMPEADGVYLGKFNLNGYTFKAYERETVDGSTQFRLSAFPSITCEQEAALIRYLVNEGLVENLVQGLSKRIEEETNWAFSQ